MQFNAVFLLVSLTVFLGSFALVFGLTYLPCYSAICVEQNFPYDVRIHIISFYASIAAYLLVYILRVKFLFFRDALGSFISSRPIPFTSTRVSWGGFFVAFGLLGFVGASQGYFWEDERDFYRNRALSQAGTTLGTTRLAIVGSSGHICDMLAGLMVLPISRNGVLRTILKFDIETLLRFHKLVGYLLLLATFIHFIPFFAWIPVFAMAKAPLKSVFGVDNPTMSQPEVEENYYYASVLASGVLAVVIMIVIAITSLPKYRRRSYNTFYITHFLSILFFVLISIHASTDFYLLLPGLLLWLGDWLLRLSNLSSRVNAQLRAESNGWYRLTVQTKDLPSDILKGLETEMDWPLKHFYLNVPVISKWQSHPFTTTSAICGSNNVTREINWLFRASKLDKKSDHHLKEWTVKLAALLASDEGSTTMPDVERGCNAVEPISCIDETAEGRIMTLPMRTIPIRLEGPYAAHHNPFTFANSCACIVAGTGISGALSLANTFLTLKGTAQNDTQPPRKCVTDRFTIFWSIRSSENADLLDVQMMMTEAHALGVQIELHRHLTGVGKQRLNFKETIERCISPVESVEKPVTDDRPTHRRPGDTWIYFSGPTAFMNDGETACHVLKETSVGESLVWHCAKWDV